MKKLAFALAGAGLLLIVVSASADLLGLGGDTGIGGTQLLGILTGAALALLGIGLLTVNWDQETGSRESFRLFKLSNLPILFWALSTFLLTYISFFLLPLFFSGTQIQYLTKYIPDAYITRIGFDIEAIVSRIQAWLGTGQSPYADGFIAYPPLAVAIFGTFGLFGYPAYFKLMVALTVLAYLGAALAIPWAVIPMRNRALLMLFFISGLLSYGLQFEQERGQFNLIAFALTLVAIYIFHFHPRFRFFAYLLFTLSVQLKVYPVFFIVMFVDNWSDWRNIIRRFLGLGLVNFALLFVLGGRLFLDFFRVITDYQLLESSRVENLSIKGFASYAGIGEAFFWLLLGLCFFTVIGHAIARRIQGLNVTLLLICTIAALVIPSVSNDYKLSILIAPMALVFCCLTEPDSSRQRFFFILLVILASLAYWTTLFPATVKPELLARNFPALIVLLISATLLNFLAPYSIERKMGSPAGNGRACKEFYNLEVGQ